MTKTKKNAKRLHRWRDVRKEPKPNTETIGAIRKRIREKYALLLRTAYALIGVGASKGRTARFYIESYQLPDGSWCAKVAPEYGDSDKEGYVTLTKQPIERAALSELDTLLGMVIALFQSGFEKLGARPR